MNDLQREAANTATSPARLQELAATQPALRPIIALNPSAYPSLVEWLGTLNDPAVTAALNQRAATQRRASESQPTRVSVYDRPGRSAPIENGPPPPAGQNGPPPHPEPSAPQVRPVQPPPSKYPMQPTVRTPVPDHSRRNLIVTLVALLIVAGAGVFVVWQLLRPSEPVAPTAGEETEQAAQTDTESTETEPGETEQAEESDETTGEEAPEEHQIPLYPAPSGAFQFDHFMAPSGNIVCELNETSVTCTIKSHEYEGGPLRTCGPGALSLTLTEEGGKLDCAHQPLNASGAATLSYSDYTEFGDNVCLSTERGITCWNVYSGESFALAREGYGFDTHPMRGNDFPWHR